ncbi:MAG: hypothetical protein ACE5RG_09565, partial [Candidatus Nitrosomaritimum yanchengensis]
TPHALVGMAIATKIPNPLISIPLAFTSHFILDMVPHWNPHINTELKKHGKITNKSVSIIVGDLFIAGASTLAISSSVNDVNMYVLIIAAAAAIMPDAIEAPYFFLKSRNKLLLKYVKFQKSIQVDADFWPGVVTQIAVGAAALLWLLG